MYCVRWAIRFREYKKASILAPVFVAVEGILKLDSDHHGFADR